MAFTIGANHVIEHVPDGWDFEFKPDRVSGVKIAPIVIVIHYGVTLTQEELERALLLNDYVSAHLALTARGQRRDVTQMVPFNVQAGHAGSSALWRGKGNVNRYSIGIEINNPGPLLLRADGLFRDVHGRVWDGEVFEAPHPHNRTAWKYWARYTELEIAAVTALCLALKDRYPSIGDIVGHDEIRKDKFDPGPAFPIAALRQSVLGVAA